MRLRTTSACAENTKPSKTHQTHQWNYLRVRGEYSIGDAELLEQLELPPRARRIRGLANPHAFPLGTTSACAENTHNIYQPPGGVGNYLRVRGEYDMLTSLMIIKVELPPRARRIHPDFNRGAHKNGTTSACAENTLNELGLL